MTAWESIFMQSPVNNGYYEEDGLPQQNWGWPTGTWFQTRLGFVRERQSPQNARSTRKMGHLNDLRTMQFEVG